MLRRVGDGVEGFGQRANRQRVGAGGAAAGGAATAAGAVCASRASRGATMPSGSHSQYVSAGGKPW